VKSVIYSYSINSLKQASEIIEIFNDKRKTPIIFIKYFIINGFGSEWIIELKNLLKKRKCKLFVDCKTNYGLFIDLVEKKIDFLKVEGSKKTLVRLNQIAKKNKVSVNPNFSIVDLSKIKNIRKKITNI
tara:strand:- start:1235 stop:1621 length:387 start_codon:yes stop_codon:yes gene_type:complete